VYPATGDRSMTNSPSGYPTRREDTGRAAEQDQSGAYALHRRGLRGSRR
jgi:hypothetical protein